MKDAQARAEDNEVWYVVCDESVADESPDDDDEIWTVSKDPNKTGWNTDSGYEGYGLKKADAEFLAAAANEKIEMARRK